MCAGREDAVCRGDRETNEAAAGPGAPPCGSSRASQPAAIPAETRPGLGVSMARMMDSASGAAGEGPILCQSGVLLGVGPDPAVQVLSKSS